MADICIYKYVLIKNDGTTLSLDGKTNEITHAYFDGRKGDKFLFDQDKNGRVLFFNSLFRTNNELKNAVIDSYNKVSSDKAKLNKDEFDTVLLVATKKYSRGYGFEKNPYSKTDVIRTDGRVEDNRESVVPIMYKSDFVDSFYNENPNRTMFSIRDVMPLPEADKTKQKTRKYCVLHVIENRFLFPKTELDAELRKKISQIFGSWIQSEMDKNLNVPFKDFGERPSKMSLQELLNVPYEGYLPKDNSSLWTNIMAYIALYDRLNELRGYYGRTYSFKDPQSSGELIHLSVYSKEDIYKEVFPEKSKENAELLDAYKRREEKKRDSRAKTYEERMQDFINERVNRSLDEDGEESFMTLEDYLEQNDYYTYFNSVKNQDSKSR